MWTLESSSKYWVGFLTFGQRISSTNCKFPSFSSPLRLSSSLEPSTTNRSRLTKLVFEKSFNRAPEIVSFFTVLDWYIEAKPASSAPRYVLIGNFEISSVVSFDNLQARFKYVTSSQSWIGVKSNDFADSITNPFRCFKSLMNEISLGFCQS